MTVLHLPPPEPHGPRRKRNLDACERIDAKTCRTILALAWQSHPTIRSVGKVAGDKSSNTTHQRLRVLREAGWVDWEDSHSGTLHRTFEAVDFVARKDVAS